VDWQKGFRRRLLGWFDRNKRDLPWRRTKDPYAVWLSEIMLQQTQAPTVVRYFERFLAAFPTVHALAQADQAAVLRLWEGLGYYRRAVQLHEAARKIVSEFGGQFPQTLDELLQLPGIGRYTAGAILSIAFDQRQPILEANTLRLWARLLAYPEPTGSASAQRLFWQMAEWVLPHRQVGRFNQALMELGSTVCLPRQPRCPECPVSRFCLARQQGLQKSIPRQRSKPAVEFCQEVALIVRRNGHVLLQRIPEGQRWAGLWDFPRFELPPEFARPLAEADRAIPPAMGKFLMHQMGQTGIVVRPIRRLKTIRYAVTRYRVQRDCYEADYVGRMDRAEDKTGGLEQHEDSLNAWAAGSDQPAEPLGEFHWVRLEALERYPMSSPARKLAHLAQAAVAADREKPS